MGLPIYEMAISEDLSSDLQVEFVALVDKPAIEKNFIAFNKQSFATIDEDRRIISGAAMLSNAPIYRKDDSIGEYYVVFKPETIYEIAQKFFAKGYANNFNLMHDAEMQVSGVTVFESFIADSKRGIQPMKGFEDAQDGSWFISAKVNNQQVWDLIKQGKVKGFSVEGMFQYKKELSQQEAVMNQVYSILNGIS
jgi:hypothetical protein